MSHKHYCCKDFGRTDAPHICGLCEEFGRPEDPSPEVSGPCRGISALAPGCSHWQAWKSDAQEVAR